MENHLAAFFIQSAGVTSSTLSVLKKEFITSKGIFFPYNKDHFTKLLRYSATHHKLPKIELLVKKFDSR